MTITVIIDDAVTPAEFSVMAGILAAERQLPLVCVRSEWQIKMFPDARQHVIASGALATSGLLWPERFSGKWLQAEYASDTTLPQPAEGVITSAPGQLQAVTDQLNRCRTPFRLLRTARWRRELWLESADNRNVLGERWRRDKFGRWFRASCVTSATELTRQPKVIGLIGTENDQWQSYPATLAALGDAADYLDLPIQVRYLSPVTITETLKALSEVDAIVLPGGANMSHVPGQIAVAHATLSQAIPTLGLCLGMQTMATAAVQQLPILGNATLEEADPTAAVKTFVPLMHPALTGQHRCGLSEMKTVPGTRMATLVGDSTPMHYNHRYQFNPQLIDALAQTGIAVCARAGSETIVDAIEAANGQFWCGVQGHPELGSRQGAPHPLIIALLRCL